MAPLTGVRVVEFAAIGPVQFAGTMLADMGADVVRIDRADRARPPGGGGEDTRLSFLDRGRRSVALDLKQSGGVEVARRLVTDADILIEGYRPGVMERFGLGPSHCHPDNPALIYGRMTGWGQDGPYAQAPGHDINYIALAGALHAIGPRGGPPVPPLMLVGDFGGGAMMLLYGIVCALLEARSSGTGQVVDAAMVDGVSALMGPIMGAHAAGGWSNERGTNMLDGGAHFYGVYETADGRYVAVGAIEPEFYAELLERIGLGGEELPHQMDQRSWPRMRERFAEVFATRTRDEWVELLEDTETCFAPVLSMDEAQTHPHQQARNVFVEAGEGARQPRPVPRMSGRGEQVSGRAPAPGADTDTILAELGLDEVEREALRDDGAVA